MVRGIGIDLVELDRIRDCHQRFGTRFIQKILTKQETARLNGRRDPVPYLAAMFAAKEAAVKALGTGFAQGVTLHNVEILHLPSGQPELHLHGRALEVAQALGVSSTHISLTHARDTAGAVVVLDG
ncbi:holo-[acyl-carrier protein] synthase [Paucidesulfovibrio gracilis DSM 16080]|uniref:Holo-[acyl-carrier-protein] synthase n=1 Tax=Paucidesulfovibrio gracilis DSM 16080 TaxID=1121449 RepID=A0A1T4WTP2_9BACT|nr:holo-[acyl-carrier-protein] synthase [Paucidesulfovibrio gracilis]SKA80733.1 holo-[acyl-carrier protein] synthase [Paucidesulfovibrio gracilis DSM 16080]